MQAHDSFVVLLLIGAVLLAAARLGVEDAARTAITGGVIGLALSFLCEVIIKRRGRR